eukprot:m.136700 g.136700  ORF g.136700 m.136700 type:complete len:226 (+) comp9905_c0_seq2:1-678(+)
MEGTYLATNQRIPRQWWRRASNEMRALTIANGALLALLLATSFYRKFVRIDCRAELPSIISNMIHDIHVSCGEAACNGVSDPMVTLDYLAGRSRVIETCRREIIAFFAAKPTYHNVDITVRPGPSLELRSLTPDPPLFCQMTRTLAETWHLYQFHLLCALPVIVGSFWCRQHDSGKRWLLLAHLLTFFVCSASWTAALWRCNGFQGCHRAAERGKGCCNRSACYP